jgi:hypothetical protein
MCEWMMLNTLSWKRKRRTEKTEDPILHFPKVIDVLNPQVLGPDEA